MNDFPDWYERRGELEPGMVFSDYQGDLVKLERRVPGDGTRWEVANWNSYTNGWTYDGNEVEPGELRTVEDDPDEGPPSP